MDNKALFKISYGLYVLTACAEDKDNGCIINTLLQVSSGNPVSGVIAVNKQNHTHDMIMATRNFNVCALTTETPFKVFEHFGFQSGKTVDKFAGCEQEAPRSNNGLVYLPKFINAYISGQVTDTIDFGSHTMFRADFVDSQVLSSVDSLTYAYYQQHVKPKPQLAQSVGWRCNICGYVHEGAELPADFVCPLCKHGPADFVKL